MAIPGASAAAGNCVTTAGVVGGFPAACNVGGMFAMWAQKPTGLANTLPGPTPAPVAGVANGGNTFVATAGAFIGGGVADHWAINETKNVQNGAGVIAGPTLVGLD